MSSLQLLDFKMLNQDKDPPKNEVKWNWGKENWWKIEFLKEN